MPNSTRYLGKATTQRRYPLVVGSPFGIPYLIDKPDYEGASAVTGELYEVDGSALEVLDRFEGTGNGFYVRRKVVLCTGDDLKARYGESVSATTYFRDESEGGPTWARECTIANLLTLPMVSEYGQSHSESFVARDARNASWREKEKSLKHKA